MRTIFFLTALTILTSCGDTGADVVTSGSFTNQLNALRAAQGLAPLTENQRLENAAAAHARDMARQGYFSHRAPNGENADKRIARAGYAACGWAENIASGQRSESSVFQAWRNSRGHRRNMLGSRYTEFGLARVGAKWVIVVARPC